MTPTTLVVLGEEDLDRLRPLWAAMLRSYAELAGDELPMYDEPESWRRRRPTYAAMLADPDAFVLARERAGELLAYAAVRIVATSTVFAWSERAGELETLVVADGQRGHGLGAQLLADVRAELARRGVTETTLHVVASNERAIDFYRREGFRPYLVLMSDAMPPAGGSDAPR
jgi:ribosomal protein S18 acetylase RimI-like enzyme